MTTQVGFTTKCDGCGIETDEAIPVTKKWLRQVALVPDNESSQAIENV